MRTLNDSSSCEAAATTIDSGMEILYGGLRPLPSGPDDPSRDDNVLSRTTRVHKLISDKELEFAVALGEYALNGGCSQQGGRALDLKLFIEQMNEVANALAVFTFPVCRWKQP